MAAMLASPCLRQSRASEFAQRRLTDAVKTSSVEKHIMNRVRLLKVSLAACGAAVLGGCIVVPIGGFRDGKVGYLQPPYGYSYEVPFGTTYYVPYYDGRSDHPLIYRGPSPRRGSTNEASPPQRNNADQGQPPR
jgi:hypothetical protein